MIRHLFLLISLSLLVLPAPCEGAGAVAQVPGMVCHGESDSVALGLSVSEIEDEIDKRRRQLASETVPSHRVAHYHCVLGELSRRIGSLDARDYFETAIRLNPSEPAYELFLARYLVWSRGAAAPLSEDAEIHALRALEKLESFRGVTQVGESNDVVRDWTRKLLLLIYESDGIPALPHSSRAHPYQPGSPYVPQLFLGGHTSVASDTTDFWDFADTRRFTTEYLLLASRLRGTAPTLAQAASIVRAPLRTESNVRLRMRQNWLGEVDLSASHALLEKSQITDFSAPQRQNDVVLDQVSVAQRRSYDLKWFDLSLELNGAMQSRTGVVENQPGLNEPIGMLQVSPTLSRYLGPDKLTVGGSYIYFDMPENTQGPVDERERQRVVRVVFVDYAFYRPFVLPQLHLGTFERKRELHRGVHLFGMGMQNDERFGQTVTYRADLTLGTAIKGIAGNDVWLMGSVYDMRAERGGVPETNLSSRQFRASVQLRHHLVDPDRTPGMPGFFQSASLVFPMRHDLALDGPKLYQNFRVGAELWSMLFAAPLRGTGFLLTLSGAYQNFYELGRHEGLFSATVRMGWPELGNVPALF